MNPEQGGAPDPREEHGSLLLLVLLACVVGAGAGAIGTLFRLCLEHADAWRDALIGWAHVAPICTLGPSRPSASPDPIASSPPKNFTGNTLRGAGGTSWRNTAST